MKKLLLLWVIALMASKTFATDLLVEEFGSLPVYNTISAAVAAANDGDRIIIRNRTGGLPWIEDVTVNKSLEFLSYDNDTFFIVQGNYTIIPASGRVISFISMRNLGGGISATTTGTGSRTVVNILDSYFVSGNLLFDQNGFQVTIAGCQLSNGFITLRYGSVIGNDLSYASTAPVVRVNTDATATNDAIRIIGNRISAGSPSTANDGISWNSTAQFFDIRNNFVEFQNVGIRIVTTKNANNLVNKIHNNAIRINPGSASNGVLIYGINITAVGANAIVEVMNNIMDMASSSSNPVFYGIHCTPSTGQRFIYYNAVDNNTTLDNKISGNWTINANNDVTQVINIGSAGVPTGTVHVNAGNPANPYYDLDLTPNDLGCYGGSYSHANFFPLFSGSARIYFVDYPFNVRQGNTLSITSEAFDR